jgi:hypothetical protein
LAGLLNKRQLLKQTGIGRCLNKYVARLAKPPQSSGRTMSTSLVIRAIYLPNPVEQKSGELYQFENTISRLLPCSLLATLQHDHTIDTALECNVGCGNEKYRTSGETVSKIGVYDATCVKVTNAGTGLSAVPCIDSQQRPKLECFDWSVLWCSERNFAWLTSARRSLQCLWR